MASSRAHGTAHDEFGRAIADTLGRVEKNVSSLRSELSSTYENLDYGGFVEFGGWVSKSQRSHTVTLAARPAEGTLVRRRRE